MPTKHVSLADDVSIHVVYAGETTLPGDPPPLRRGATLVFIHGEGGSAPLWSRQHTHFAAQHSPIAIDLPGHGRSTGLDGPATVADAAKTVADVLRAIDAPPAILVGHGLGGQIALSTALAHPDRVRGVVTIGTAARAQIAESLIGQLESVVNGRLGQQFDTPFFGANPDMAIMRELWGEIVKTDPRVRLTDLRAYGASDLRVPLARLAVPLVVIQGDADKLCPRECADELVAAVPGASLVVVEGAGHVAHLEKPEAVNRAIEDLATATVGSGAHSAGGTRGAS